MLDHYFVPPLSPFSFLPFLCPQPGLEPEVKEQLWSAAVRAAKAVGYVGAGTYMYI